VQLQLLAYLAAICRWPETEKLFGAKQLIPAGVFYVNLRGQFEGGDTRIEALADAIGARNLAYRHAGRFDSGVLEKLDSAKAADQFNYRLNKNGGVSASSKEALPRAEFEKLLVRVETQLRETGGRIFSGTAQVDPYRKGKQTPCEFCDYQAACRIDKWTHQYRVLRAAKAETDFVEQ
jgi:ATP-dependent helicase/nuclease subunit B